MNPPRNSDTGGTLYFKGERDNLSGEESPYFKVGIVRGEKEASDRDAALRTGNPRTITPIFQLESPFVQDLETRLHNEFAFARVSSGEWFSKKLVPIESVIGKAELLNKQLMENQDALGGLSALKKEPLGSQPLRPSAKELKLATERSETSAYLKLVDARRRQVDKLLRECAARDPFVYEWAFKLSSKKEKRSLSATEVKKRYPELYDEFRSVPTISMRSKFIDLSESSENTDHDSRFEIPSDSQIDELDSNPRALHQSFLRLWGIGKELSWDIWILEAKLFWISRNHRGIDGVLEWSEHTSSVFDKKRFAETFPELAEECMVSSAAKDEFQPAEWASYAP